MVRSIDDLESNAGTSQDNDAKTTVRRVKWLEWVEVDNESGSVQRRYIEAGRTDDYVNLYCPLADKQIRYLAAWAESKTDGKWARAAEGHWKSSQAEVRISYLFYPLSLPGHRFQAAEAFVGRIQTSRVAAERKA